MHSFLPRAPSDAKKRAKRVKHSSPHAARRHLAACLTAGTAGSAGTLCGACSGRWEPWWPARGRGLRFHRCLPLLVHPGGCSEDLLNLFLGDRVVPTLFSTPIIYPSMQGWSGGCWMKDFIQHNLEDFLVLLQVHIEHCLEVGIARGDCILKGGALLS
jgi:hypothetical protein